MRTSRQFKCVLMCAGVWLGAGAASANDNFEQATQQLCEHIRQCTLQTLDAQKIDSNMRQMVEGMVKGMCSNMIQRFEVSGYEDIKDSAAACMRSMAERDCDALDAGATTPACQDYEEMTKQYNARGN